VGETCVFIPEVQQGQRERESIASKSHRWICQNIFRHFFNYYFFPRVVILGGLRLVFGIFCLQHTCLQPARPQITSISFGSTPFASTARQAAFERRFRPSAFFPVLAPLAVTTARRCAARVLLLPAGSPSPQLAVPASTFFI